jgi:hypothetical protein
MEMVQEILNKLWEIYKYNNKLNRIKAGMLHLSFNNLLVIIRTFTPLELIMKAHIQLKVLKFYYLKKTK